MGDLLRMALRNTARNTRRTALTAMTILLGTTLLIIGLSWLDGLLGGMVDNIAATAGEVRVLKPEYEAREELFPLYENIPETAPVVKAIQDAGYDAHPLIRVGVTVSAGDELGEHFGLLLGAERSYYEDVMNLDEQIVEGAFFTPGEESAQVILGKTLAADVGAKVGEEVLFLGQTQDGSISPIKGLLVGGGYNYYLSTVGIDFSKAANVEASGFAFDTMFYTNFTVGPLLGGLVFGSMVAILASFIPASTASKLNPADAVRAD